MTLAASCGDADIIVELVKAGANLNLQNKVQQDKQLILPDYSSDILIA